MPRDLTSERHYALDMNDFCCNGNCYQGSTCPRYRDITAVSASWFWSTACIAAIGVIGLAILVLT